MNKRKIKIGIAIIGILWIISAGLALWVSFVPELSKPWDRSLVISWLQITTSGVAFAVVIFAISVSLDQLKIATSPTKLKTRIEGTGMHVWGGVGDKKRDSVGLYLEVQPGVSVVREFDFQVIVSYSGEKSPAYTVMPQSGEGMVPSEFYANKLGDENDRKQMFTARYTANVELQGSASIQIGSITLSDGRFDEIKWRIFHPHWFTSGHWIPEPIDPSLFDE